MKIYVKFKGEAKRELTDAEILVWKNGAIFGIPLGMVIGGVLLLIMGLF